MKEVTLLYLLTIDILLCGILFVYVFRRKKWVGIQLGMNISQAMGGVAALLAGIVLILAFPFHFSLITITSAAIGAAAGAAFGLLFDYQTCLAGVTNGFMVGIMAPMLGSVLDMPGQIILFVHGLFLFCFLFIIISIQRS
ncbi:hypothetical protein L2D08_11730 [Domibacillus sp. PGB-M46]|uniref:hypothetical protein n=1 Tax=Domibacillus sp. PGB-M46 TaxID=2910255 RepID=UPI001F58E22A|nr:hypothetical protein [Domibacillus sp. PGB-M46]MCI2255035.1 hypothetical protein [Domibacillus sp. PGB-M46]